MVGERFPLDSASMNLIIRRVSVSRKGGAKGGTMEVRTGSRVLKQAKLFLGKPLGSDLDTVPIELMAAAHATSFCVALWKELRLKSSTAGEIITTVTVALEHLAGGWTIINVHLNVFGRLLKMTQRKFIDATVRTQTKCLTSQALRISVSINTKLEVQPKPAAKHLA